MQCRILASQHFLNQACSRWNLACTSGLCYADIQADIPLVLSTEVSPEKAGEWATGKTLLTKLHQDLNRDLSSSQRKTLWNAACSVLHKPPFIGSSSHLPLPDQTPACEYQRVQTTLPVIVALRCKALRPHPGHQSQMFPTLRMTELKRNAEVLEGKHLKGMSAVFQVAIKVDELLHIEFMCMRYICPTWERYA